MSDPIEVTLGERAFRLLGPALIVVGLATWAAIPAWQAVTSGVTYKKVTGGGLSLEMVRTLVGVGLSILGAIVYVKAKGPTPAMIARVTRNTMTRSGGIHTSARVVEVHSSTKLWADLVEVYATFDVADPPYTAQTTIVVERAGLGAFRPGATIAICVDRDDKGEIALEA
jgi:hypothetical protein